MLDAGGGSGGGSGTNWNGVDMKTMWHALENQDTTPHWQLLTGWQTSYELTNQHLSDVKRYRENLATAWPPEKSPAAAAYVARLDDLITYLQGTYDAAVANHSAFSATTLALADTRTKLKKLHDEYVANQSQIDAYNTKMASNQGGVQATTARKNEQPPVAADRQQQLVWEARSLMFGLSSEVTQAHTSITKPAEYQPDESVAQDRNKRQGTTYVPPTVPPLFSPDSRPRSSGSGLPNNAAVAPTGPVGTANGPGLVLGGTSPSHVNSPSTSGPGLVPQPSVSPPPTNVINPPIGVPGGGGLPPSSNPLPGTTRSAALLKPGAGGTPPGAMRSMPPGGIIGGLPGAGLGQPNASARAAQRINPVGGVISPGVTAGRSGPTSGLGLGRPAGTPVSSTSGFGGVGGIAGRTGNHRGEGDEVARWDPDNPWLTDEGVAPVVLPSAEQRIDPGPAIGFDR